MDALVDPSPNILLAGAALYVTGGVFSVPSVAAPPPPTFPLLTRIDTAMSWRGSWRGSQRKSG
jgi:hypothetical protein